MGDPVPLAEARLLAPVTEPPSIRDFYAFEQHVRTARSRRGLEMHPDWYELPIFYFSNPAAVLGPGDQVAAPPRSAELDYELEVACVLGHGGANLRLEDADQAIAGFMVMNDWSARDIQRREMALSLGPAEGKDFATSLGPTLVTAAEFAPGGLREVPSAVMTARVNGVEWSRADLDGLWWSFAEMLVYASEWAPSAAATCSGRARAGPAHPGAVAGPRGREVPLPPARGRGRAGGGRAGALANRVVADDAPVPARPRAHPPEAGPVTAPAGGRAGRPSGCWRRPGGSGPARWSCPTTP